MHILLHESINISKALIDAVKVCKSISQFVRGSNTSDQEAYDLIFEILSSRRILSGF
jgi:hypothetical protein